MHKGHSRCGHEEMCVAQAGGEEARRGFRGDGKEICGEITVRPSRERWKEREECT